MASAQSDGLLDQKVVDLGAWCIAVVGAFELLERSPETKLHRVGSSGHHIGKLFAAFRRERHFGFVFRILPLKIGCPYRRLRRIERAANSAVNQWSPARRPRRGSSAGGPAAANVSRRPARLALGSSIGDDAPTDCEPARDAIARDCVRRAQLLRPGLHARMRIEPVLAAQRVDRAVNAAHERRHRSGVQRRADQNASVARSFHSRSHAATPSTRPAAAPVLPWPRSRTAAARRGYVGSATGRPAVPAAQSRASRSRHRARAVRRATASPPPRRRGHAEAMGATPPLALMTVCQGRSAMSARGQSLRKTVRPCSWAASMPCRKRTVSRA